jgi:adenylate cyclase class 2
MIEVEAKFAVDAPEQLFAAVQAINPCEPFEESEEIDEYFNHPARDFRITDEALRIRRTGDSVQLTWKGPRLDAVTKSRKELELPISYEAAALAFTADQLRDILLALGFTSAGIVRKKRKTTTVLFDDRHFTVSFDQVEGLAFYVELEILCEEAQRAGATASLLRLAEHLGLHQSERRSYIELVQGNLRSDVQAT